MNKKDPFEPEKPLPVIGDSETANLIVRHNPTGAICRSFKVTLLWVCNTLGWSRSDCVAVLNTKRKGVPGCYLISDPSHYYYLNEPVPERKEEE